MMRLLELTDKAAGGLVAAGAISGPVIGITERSRRDRSHVAIRLYYGLVGAAATYSLIRRLGLRSKRERRLAAIERWYDQAESYHQRAHLYRKTAKQLWRQRDQIRKQALSKLPKVYAGNSAAS